MARVLPKTQFPFIGGSYEARSRTQDCSRSVNLYPELHSYGEGKNQGVAALYSRGGLKPTNTVGTGPIRASYTVSNTQISYIVSGNEVYQITSAAGTAVRLTGNLTTSTGFVSIADNGVDVLLVDGANGYTIKIGVQDLNLIADPHFYNGAVTCTYQGGYFICDMGPNLNTFFISGLDTVTWPPLNISSVDSSPDPVKFVLSNNQQLYLGGTRTIETWTLTGASGASPFEPIQGRSINIGCLASATVCRLAGTFIFLGANEQGGAIVYSFEGESPTRISTPAIEFRLSQLGDLSTSTAFAWQESGHQFYALNCPGAETTYVYDMTTKQWVEFQSMSNGVINRYLGQTHCYLNGVHIMGDYRNGNIYVVDTTYFLDNDQPLRRIRQTPHAARGVNYIKYGPMQVDCQPGSGTLTINPRYVLEVSQDGGFTWKNPMYAKAGLVGNYLARARWNVIGSCRDPVFRITCDDPVDVTFVDCYLWVEEGIS